MLIAHIKYLSICFQILNVRVIAGLLPFSSQKPRLLLGVCTSPCAVKRKKKELQEQIYVELYITYGQSQEKHPKSAFLTQ